MKPHTQTYELEKGLLIIANYNQMAEIGSVLARCERFFSKQNTVVVDDASTDGSGEYAQEKGFRVIRQEKNMGIGAGIRSGIDFALANGFTWVLISSSNGKIRPEDYKTVYTPLVTGEADYVTGSRFTPGGSSPGLTPFRRFAIPLFSLFTFPFLGKRFSDITCGFRAYSLELFKNPKCNIHQEWLNRYELEYYIHYWACRLGARIKEVPVTIPYTHLAKGRKSKIRPFVGWWSMIRPFVYLRFGVRS
jgi:dolichol-phosphate mannosyltransferase